MENCTGVKGLDLLVDEKEKDPFLALARRYLQIPCSCMTPNAGRLDLLNRLIGEFIVDGVVDLTWQCCHTYNIESRMMGDFVEKDMVCRFSTWKRTIRIPMSEQLRTRIEAFSKWSDGRLQRLRRFSPQALKPEHSDGNWLQEIENTHARPMQFYS